MATPMTVFSAIASRFGVNPQDEEAVDVFFEETFFTLDLLEQDEIMKELLESESLPENVINLRQTVGVPIQCELKNVSLEEFRSVINAIIEGSREDVNFKREVQRIVGDLGPLELDFTDSIELEPIESHGFFASVTHLTVRFALPVASSTTIDIWRQIFLPRLQQRFGLAIQSSTR